MGQFSMEKPALKGQFSVEINKTSIDYLSFYTITYAKIVR